MGKSIQEQLQHYEYSFPVLGNLSRFLKSSNFFSGAKIGWHCHLTAQTAAAVQVLTGAGAELFISECAPGTSDPESIEYMKQVGARVYLGSDSPRKVLEAKPEIISDTGFVLCSEYLKCLRSGEEHVFGCCEITSSGISKMRALKELTLPLININDGELKTHIENYHGVGDGVMDALSQLTGRLWNGRHVSVVGYGRVGAGVAHYLKKSGAVVHIVESDPVRRLVAHYDGYGLLSLADALQNCELLITATGCKFLLGPEQLAAARNGLLLMNVGHWGEEIDLASLRASSISYRNLVDHLEEYEIQAGKKLYVAGGEGPANVVMLSGSPEPTLIHLCTEILCMQHYLKLKSEGKEAPAGENPVPKEVQKQASLLALESLGLE